MPTNDPLKDTSSELADDLVTVGKYMEPVNAQMAKSLLDSAGIECFLQGENANSLLSAAFRARLLVHQKDAAAARDVLALSDSSLAEDELDELEELDESGHGSGE